MNKNIFSISIRQFIAVIALMAYSILPSNDLFAQNFNHQLFDEVLQSCVNSEGWLDYNGLKRDRAKFDQYISLLENTHPNDSWSKNEQLAYWINAYNAFTIQLVLDHYPVNSIKDIKRGVPYVNSVWDIKFIKIGGKEYDLNNIEHGIIRKKFNDPRIHFAVNCASYSCPSLSNRAYTAAKLNEQLDAMTYAFFADKRKNKISAELLQLNSIMKWYKVDFTKGGQSLVDFVNKYTKTNIQSDAKVEYLDYDWSLNEQKS